MPHLPGAFPLFTWFAALLVSSRLSGLLLTGGSHPEQNGEITVGVKMVATKYCLNKVRDDDKYWWGNAGDTNRNSGFSRLTDVS